MSDSTTRSSRGLSLGLALTTCATLLLETTYTRIFSVTMWYHYAFMAISVALFGMAFGAVIVYLKPQWFPQERLAERLGKLGLAFALTVAATFWLHLQLPFSPSLSVVGVFSVVFAFAMITLPFIVSGVIVSLMLTRFVSEVGRLYAYDLIGSAIGCLLLWGLIHPLTGPGLVLFGAFMAALGGVAFLWKERASNQKLFQKLALCSVLFFAAAILQPQLKLLNITWIKNPIGLGQASLVPVKPIVEEWNSHSVVTVTNNLLPGAFGWGLSPTYEKKRTGNPPQQLLLTIDAAAGTVITKYTGKEAEIEGFKYDVTALVHYLRPQSRVLVIGTGGGKDILTALSFNPRQVTGVEINSNILHLINDKDKLGDFTGHLDKNPKVRFVNDEARSWVERSQERFDIIQASLIDSWAATSAGAFVLTENSLYTVEAWRSFLSHLSQRGVLTMSRWWIRERPGEMLRCASLAYEALKELGVSDPRKHVMIAVTNAGGGKDEPSGVGTILVSRLPFTDADIATFKSVCTTLEFKPLLTPDAAEMPAFASLLDPAKHEATLAAYPLNVGPVYDDNPFFFNMLRFSDLLRFGELEQGVTDFNIRAVAVLGALLGLMLVLCVGGLFVPLWLHERTLRQSGAAPMPGGALWRHGLYFAAIGLGFILIEIGQIQRLTMFLGHPVYSLTVVLFTLLLATALGAALAGRFVVGRGAGRARFMLGLAAFVTLLAALATPLLLAALGGTGIEERLILAALIVAAIGLPLGACFPLGLSLAAGELPRGTPWLWAINGALSVLGSVTAVIVSISVGITMTCVLGALAYLAALALIWQNTRGD